MLVSNGVWEGLADQSRFQRWGVSFFLTCLFSGMGGFFLQRQEAHKEALSVIEAENPYPLLFKMESGLSQKSKDIQKSSEQDRSEKQIHQSQTHQKNLTLSKSNKDGVSLSQNQIRMDNSAPVFFQPKPTQSEFSQLEPSQLELSQPAEPSHPKPVYHHTSRMRPAEKNHSLAQHKSPRSKMDQDDVEQKSRQSLKALSNVRKEAISSSFLLEQTSQDRSHIHHRYDSLIYHRIQSNLIYPFQARRQKIDGIVLIEFRLNSKGKLLNAHILDSSQHALLDRAALKTIRNLDPFPPFFKDMSFGSKTFIIPIEYRHLN